MKGGKERKNVRGRQIILYTKAEGFCNFSLRAKLTLPLSAYCDCRWPRSWTLALSIMALCSAHMHSHNCMEHLSTKFEQRTYK